MRNRSLGEVTTGKLGVVWRALVASLLIAAAVGVGAAAPASACSCLAATVTAESLAESDAAFVGTVRGRDGDVITFAVDRVYAGRLGPVVDVVAGTNSASCGLDARRGQRLGLFLGADGGGWRSGLCSAHNPAEFEAVSLGYGPDESIGRGVAPRESGLLFAVNLWMAMVLGAIAVAFAAWGERRARGAVS